MSMVKVCPFLGCKHKKQPQPIEAFMLKGKECKGCKDCREYRNAHKIKERAEFAGIITGQLNVPLWQRRRYADWLRGLAREVKETMGRVN